MRPYQIRGRLRMYERNGFQTRKITHENAVSPVDAKSSFLPARRAPVGSEGDFACRREMACRREKVRTRKPFLSEMRSHHHSGCSAPCSGERSTSRVSRESACTRENLRTKNNLRLKAKSSNSRSMTNCEIKQNRPSASWMICEIK